MATCGAGGGGGGGARSVTGSVGCAGGRRGVLPGLAMDVMAATRVLIASWASATTSSTLGSAAEVRCAVAVVAAVFSAAGRAEGWGGAGAEGVGREGLADGRSAGGRPSTLKASTVSSSS